MSILIEYFIPLCPIFFSRKIQQHLNLLDFLGRESIRDLLSMNFRYIFEEHG